MFFLQIYFCSLIFVFSLSFFLQYILETRASAVYFIDHSLAGIFMAGGILLPNGALCDYTSFCTHVVYLHNTIAIDDMSAYSYSFLINKDNNICELSVYTEYIYYDDIATDPYSL